MEQERKLKIVLSEVLVSLILCMFLIVVKFVWKDEGIIEEIYNYLITDVVFLLRI